MRSSVLGILLALASAAVWSSSAHARPGLSAKLACARYVEARDFDDEELEGVFQGVDLDNSTAMTRRAVRYVASLPVHQVVRAHAWIALADRINLLHPYWRSRPLRLRNAVGWLAWVGDAGATLLIDPSGVLYRTDVASSNEYQRSGEWTLDLRALGRVDGPGRAL